MASILGIDTIQNTVGTTAMTINTTGNVSVKVAGSHAFVDFGGPSSYTSLSAGIIQFDNIVENIGNDYNTSTYKYTCPVDGLYQVSIHMLSQTDTDKYAMDLYKANTRIGRNYVVHRAGHATNFVSCSAGDTLHWELTTSSFSFYQATGTERYTYAIYSLIYAT